MDLAVPSFLIAIVGIILQFADAFPEHRETRKVIVVMCIGFFVGSLANALSGATYNVTGNVDYKAVIIFSLLAVLILFALLGTLLNDEKKRDSASGAAWVAVGLFVLAGFVVSLSGIEQDPTLSTDEIILLARSAETRGDIDRAIALNKQLKSRVSSPADDIIQKKIDALIEQQMPS
ncbi:MAG: hypothetical protein ABI668_14230 [Sphingorhabdus sp.]